MFNDELIEAHLAHLRYLNYAPSTVYQRRRVLIRLIRSARLPLDAVGEDDVRARLDSIRGADARACELSHVRGFYRWAIEYDRLPSDPTRRLRRPRLARRLPRPIGEEDLRHALQTASPRLRPWFLLAGWAGLRACEIARLRAEHLAFDTEPPLLIVRSGKGNADGAVPMSRWLVEQLLACDLPTSGYLFRRCDSNDHVPPHLVSHLTAQHLRSVGIDATLHQLRHRFGTQIHRGCRDLRVTQELLRHRSPNSTAIYTFVSSSDTTRAVEGLPRPDAA